MDACWHQLERPALRNIPQRIPSTTAIAVGSRRAFAPISEDLRRAIDTECSVAYAHGAEAVWSMLGVGALAKFPNVAEFDDATGLYVIRPKSARHAESAPSLPPTP